MGEQLLLYFMHNLVLFRLAIVRNNRKVAKLADVDREGVIAQTALEDFPFAVLVFFGTKLNFDRTIYVEAQGCCSFKCHLNLIAANVFDCKPDLACSCRAAVNFFSFVESKLQCENIV